MPIQALEEMVLRARKNIFNIGLSKTKTKNAFLVEVGRKLMFTKSLLC